MNENKYCQLREAVDNVVAIDAHCHNLVSKNSSVPFLSSFTLAEGAALADTPFTLPFKRSIRDAAELYKVNASLSAIEKYRNSSTLESYGTKCFDASKLSAIFIDDGFVLDKMLDWKEHLLFVPQVGRILRIEFLALKILNQDLQQSSKQTLEEFTDLFLTQLRSTAKDVVCLKSIVAYLSGLEVNTHVTKKAAEKGLQEELQGGIPLQIIFNKNLIDYIFTLSLGVAKELNLPMQIHTGLGQKLLDLTKANPLLLRGVLEDSRFSENRFVLLHASYPFSREASYLSSVYPQVYLDFGSVDSKLSIHGMKSAIKQLFELGPLNKIMYSSDGFAFPESYYFASKNARDVIYSVLSDACDDGDLTISEAIEAVPAIFRQNALNFYDFSKVIKSG
ncbi:hypothetical protein ZOSMA_163G00200 [Zostera marina]|uniref:Amidohydrolase-related domain-containing protein n=1 Tax=Zostera marina TaxID=29655 RepID=A0A0K9PW47_ZOSMR|nr:hypothetical protein ZOSMA_163G00200 [Zostera marina]